MESGIIVLLLLLYQSSIGYDPHQKRGDQQDSQGADFARMGAGLCPLHLFEHGELRPTPQTKHPEHPAESGAGLVSVRPRFS
jgi:hypothetical protein